MAVLFINFLMRVTTSIITIVTCFFFLFTISHAQENCALVDCAEPTCTELACGIYHPNDSCCAECCPDPHGCTNCINDPCEDVRCNDNNSYKCVANFCGGCNREWFNNGIFVVCTSESFVADDDDGFTTITSFQSSIFTSDFEFSRSLSSYESFSFSRVDSSTSTAAVLYNPILFLCMVLICVFSVNHLLIQ